jgi:hypothetical protein
MRRGGVRRLWGRSSKVRFFIVSTLLDGISDRFCIMVDSLSSPLLLPLWLLVAVPCLCFQLPVSRLPFFPFPAAAER